MRHEQLKNMVGGWFVGAFKPTAYETDLCEVAVKKYQAGDNESAHFHKIATEITLILEGRVRMNGKEWVTGDIIVLSPGEVTDFQALTNVTNLVVKIPGALNDKYVV